MRERPITERRRALAIVAVLLAAGAILLAATRPSQPRAVPQRATTSLDSARPAVPAGPDAASAAPVAPGAARAARRFLAGYLAYLYGHAPAAAVTAAVPALMRTLRTRPPLVSPAMRARRPRVLALRPTSASAGRVGVSALVNDGELADYSVGLLLERGHRRLLIDAVEGAP
jgi:hypothetical protein